MSREPKADGIRMWDVRLRTIAFSNPNLQKPKPNMTTPEYSRAIVHLVTNGNEGTSPYIVCDVLSKLKKKYESVQLGELSHSPLQMSFIINDTLIWIRAGAHGEQSNTDIIFYATICGEGYLRFNALGKVNVPQEAFEQLHPVYDDWLSHWPKTTHTLPQGSQNFVPLLYTSEESFVHAIESLFAIHTMLN